MAFVVREATIVYIRMSNFRNYSLNVDQSNARENIEYDGKLKKVCFRLVKLLSFII